MTSSNQEAIDSLTERVNRLYNQVFTIPQPADSIKKPCDIIDETRCIFEQVEKKNSVVKQLWKTCEDNLRILSTQLEELKTLQNIPNASSLQGVPDNSKKLQPIIQGQMDQKEDLEEVNGRLQLLLCAYNDIISTLSKQFVIWNNLVTQCELKYDSDRSAIE
uniref:Uncharacterized protein n=1 Tax=Clytia hemisphaerica TaxID=252671 RepID=A0A7M5UBE1_9CNID